METTSIKALALKALQGNKQGNKTETDSFPDGNSAVQKEDIGKPIKYTLFYDHGILQDSFLFVKTDEEAQALRNSGVLDAVYSHREIKGLMGLPPESLRAHHAIKKAFPNSTITE